VGSSAPVQMPDEVSIAHPRANRETVLEGMRVAYLFQRVRRRSIGFLVGPDGLEVRAPKWVTLKEVELGLQERGEWVLRKWAEMQERQKNIRQIEWREGASLDYLGSSIHLCLSPQVGRSELQNGNQLCLALPLNAEPSQIRDAVQAWLMREAKTLVRASAESLCAFDGCAVASFEFVQCGFALGQCARGWRHSFELAPDSFKARSH
jgi:predicted metal-dependent hydrolase